ncbi:hypothetical protein DFJ73DRAFT_777308 [Zopfochytrium polystomum]|nr:hypothetical protein DFJ73DRAFT_777308 [Zopfochytrium polystomum]
MKARRAVCFAFRHLAHLDATFHIDCILGTASSSPTAGDSNKQPAAIIYKAALHVSKANQLAGRQQQGGRQYLNHTKEKRERPGGVQQQKRIRHSCVLDNSYDDYSSDSLMMTITHGTRRADIAMLVEQLNAADDGDGADDDISRIRSALSLACVRALEVPARLLKCK